MKVWWIGALWISIPGYLMAFRPDIVVRWETRAPWPFRTLARWRHDWMHVDPEQPQTWREYRVYGFIVLAIAAGLFIASMVAWVLNIPLGS